MLAPRRIRAVTSALGGCRFENDVLVVDAAESGGVGVEELTHTRIERPVVANLTGKQALDRAFSKTRTMFVSFEQASQI
jgi:hypothetical protein